MVVFVSKGKTRVKIRIRIMPEVGVARQDLVRFFFVTEFHDNQRLRAALFRVDTLRLGRRKIP
jgi:hypothetical protein